MARQLTSARRGIIFTSISYGALAIKLLGICRCNYFSVNLNSEKQLANIPVDPDPDKSNLAEPCYAAYIRHF